MMTKSADHPEDGDMVVREEQQDGTLLHLLRTAPDPDTLLVRSGKETVAQAMRLAKVERVRAWLTDAGDDFVLREEFRMVEPVQMSEVS